MSNSNKVLTIAKENNVNNAIMQKIVRNFILICLNKTLESIKSLSKFYNTEIISLGRP